MPVKKLKTITSNAGSRLGGTTQSSKVKAKTLKRGSLVTDIYDIKGKVVGQVDLPKEIFDAKINPKLMAQAVRVYLANQRKGTASTKTRGEVAGSTRKIYRQKGTGRARHGSIRAPIFVHGGVVFGPTPRDFSLNLPKKMRRLALVSALSAKQKEGEIKVIAGIEKIEPKTKHVVEIMENLNLNTPKKKILIVLPQKIENIKRAARNIQGLEVKLINNLNTYEVLNNRFLLFTQSAVEAMRSNDLKEA